MGGLCRNPIMNVDGLLIIKGLREMMTDKDHMYITLSCDILFSLFCQSFIRQLSINVLSNAAHKHNLLPCFIID